jgi:hypothetical protein
LAGGNSSARAKGDSIISQVFDFEFGGTSRAGFIVSRMRKSRKSLTRKS